MVVPYSFLMVHQVLFAFINICNEVQLKRFWLQDNYAHRINLRFRLRETSTKIRYSVVIILTSAVSAIMRRTFKARLTGALVRAFIVETHRICTTVMLIRFALILICRKRKYYCSFKYLSVYDWLKSPCYFFITR